jgi:Tol biopolymer transport system component
MKRFLATTLLIFSPGFAMAQAGQAPQRAITDPKSVMSADRAPVSPPPVAALFEARGGLGAAWSADGASVIVSTNTSGRYNLWRYPVDGGAPALLAPSDDRQTGQIALPDGKTVVFESDKAGNERYDLYAVPLAGGAASDLTNTPDISETSAQASPDGRTLAFDRKPKTESANNIAVMDLASRQVRVLTHEADPTYTWHLIAWTGDGRSLIADRVNLIGTRGSAWRIDATSGRAEELTPPDEKAGANGEVLTLASDISPDGRYLAVASNQGGEQTQAALFEIATRHFVWLAPTPWEQVTGSFSPDGRTLAYRTNAEAAPRSRSMMWPGAARGLSPCRRGSMTRARRGARRSRRIRSACSSRMPPATRPSTTGSMTSSPARAGG